MRRTASTAAAIGMLATLAGGGTSSASTSRQLQAGAATATRFQACMVTNIGGINDRSYNQLTWMGMQAAQAREPRRIVTRYLPAVDQADYSKDIAVFVREKCGIIVTVGLLMGRATESAAEAHPRRHFAIVDCTYRSGCLAGREVRNLRRIAFNTVQDAFLGGYLAAGMSKTHVVATYGGVQVGAVTIYLDGFWDGVQYYNSLHHTRIKVLGWNEQTQTGIFINSFTNIAAARRLTTTFINQGADVIFPVAGGSGLGTAAAVRTADASGKRIAMEWPDTDGCFNVTQYCRYFLSSVTKGIAEAVKTVVLAAARGKFRPNYIGTLANAGVALVPNHHFFTSVPAQLRAELSKVEHKIENGTLIPATRSPV